MLQKSYSGKTSSWIYYQAVDQIIIHNIFFNTTWQSSDYSFGNLFLHFVGNKNRFHFFAHCVDIKNPLVYLFSNDSKNSFMKKRISTIPVKITSTYSAF